MTPSQFDLFVKRLIMLNTPKAAWSIHGITLDAHRSLLVQSFRCFFCFVFFVRQVPVQRKPKVVVLLVLLTWWLELPKDGEAYQVLEFFAGVGRIASMSRYAGFRSAAVDIEYGKSTGKRARPPMDLNSNAGLMSLASISGVHLTRESTTHLSGFSMLCLLSVLHWVFAFAWFSTQSSRASQHSLL